MRITYHADIQMNIWKNVFMFNTAWHHMGSVLYSSRRKRYSEEDRLAMYLAVANAVDVRVGGARGLMTEMKYRLFF